MEMKKTTIAVILTIVAIIGALLLNFEESLWNDPANIKNLIVTIFYMSVWGFFLFSAAKNKNLMIYFSILWILTLTISVLMAFGQAIQFNLGESAWGWIFAPFVVLYIPFYGIRYFVDDFIYISIIIAAISFGMSMVGIILLRRFKSASEE
jgi:hypothetical protein